MKKINLLSMILAFGVVSAQAQTSSQSEAQTQSKFQLSSQTPVQDSAKRTQLKLLFHLMQQDSMISKTMDAMFSSMSSRLFSQLKDSSISRDGSKMRFVNEYMEKIRQYSKDMVHRLINEDMMGIYAKYFTLKEVDDFVAFYQSSSGQKLLHQMPDITKELMSVMYTKYIPDMQKLLTDDLQKIMDEKSEAK